MGFNFTSQMPRLGNDISAERRSPRACVVLHQGAKGSQLALLSWIITLFKRHGRPNKPQGSADQWTYITHQISIDPDVGQRSPHATVTSGQRKQYRSDQMQTADNCP